MDNAMFSILTPSFNYCRFLPDASNSVRLQDCRAEHIVMDGGSTDGTLRLLQQWPHPLKWASEKDSGQSNVLNKALALASGKWIEWLNADEFYLPNALPSVRRALDFSGADIVYGDSVFVDESGRLLRLYPQHGFSALSLKWYGCYTGSYSTFISREALEGGWDSSLKRTMDWDLWLRLANSGKSFCYLPTPLSAFRVHDSQITAKAASWNHPDLIILRERYGLPDSRMTSAGARVLGTIDHGLRKALRGGYLKEGRVRRRLHGTGMRWFESEGGANNVEILRLITQ